MALNILLSLGLMLVAILLSISAKWEIEVRGPPKEPEEYHRKPGYRFAPNPWEIEAMVNERFKPYVNKNKNKPLNKSIPNNKSCFGKRARYRVTNETENVIFIIQGIRDQLNEVANQYLAQYCKGNRCGVHLLSNKYICYNSSKDITPHGDWKSPAQVLKYLKFYLYYQFKKYSGIGVYQFFDDTRKEGEWKQRIAPGKPCVQPPYKLPFDQEPTKEEQEEIDKLGTKYLGVYCKKDKCHYDFKSKMFLCSSSSIQPMALLILLLFLYSHLLNPLVD